jgi:hypothetical protein
LEPLLKSRLELRPGPGLPLRWFWLINLVLLALFVWSLTERVEVTVKRSGDRCTAILMDRTSEIPCAGLEGGHLGFFRESVPRQELSGLIRRGPLEWLAPGAAWKSERLLAAGDDGQSGSPVAQGLGDGFAAQETWQQVMEGLLARSDRPAGGEGATVQGGIREYIERLPPVFSVEAELHRPRDAAGLVLLEPGGRSGWIFLLSDRERSGAWYQWQEGSPAQIIRGIPLDSAFQSQAKSLLRETLGAHHGALLLLAVGWLLVRTLGWSASMRFPRPKLPASRIRSQTVALAVTLFTFWATVTIAVQVLERLPHVQDSVTYLFQAQTLARGRLWAPEPPLPEFFEQEFLLVQEARWLGKYPPGYPMLLALGVLLSQPWLINPYLATLTVPLLYKLGAALYGRRVGLGAALLAAVSPFFLFMSGSMMAHAAELFWITLFMLSWIWALRRSRGAGWAVMAGLSFGMAFLTRQAAAVAAGIPFIAMTMAPALRNGRARTAFSRLAIMAAAALPLVALLFAYQYAVTGDPLEDPRQRYWSFDRLGFGEELGMAENTFAISVLGEHPAMSWYYDPSQPPLGHSPARGLFNTERNWRSLEANLFGWIPLFTLAFCFLAFVARRPNWADLSLLAVIIGVLGIYVAYWSTGISYGPRYYYAALPAFLLLTVRGVQAAAERLGSGHGGVPVSGAEAGTQACVQLGKLVMAAPLVAFVLGNLIFSMPTYLERYRGYNFVGRPALTLAGEGPGGPAILFVGVTEKNNWWEYGQYFSSNTPWLDGPIIYARDLGDEENARLMALYTGFASYRVAGDELIPLDLFGEGAGSG